MANINKGILGGLNGKIGNVVGYNQRGKSVIRSSKSKDSSLVGTAMLSRQSFLRNFLNQISKIPQSTINQVVTPINSKWSVKQAAIFNICNKVNIDNPSSYGLKDLIPSNLNGLSLSTVSYLPPLGRVTFSWYNLEQKSDMLYPCYIRTFIVGINCDDFLFGTPPIRVSDGSATFNMPNASSGNIYYVQFAMLSVPTGLQFVSRPILSFVT